MTNGGGDRDWRPDKDGEQRTGNLEELKKQSRKGGERGKDRQLWPEGGTLDQIAETAKMWATTRSMVTARVGFCRQVESKVTKGKRDRGGKDTVGGVVLLNL